jgi:hypothetical protein
MEPVYRRTIRADLTRFGSATGLGTVYGAAAEDFQPGDVVLVADEDSDVLWAEVVATRSGAADVRVFWDRRPVVRTELSPVMRDLGVTEVTDGDLAPVSSCESVTGSSWSMRAGTCTAESSKRPCRPATAVSATGCASRRPREPAQLPVGTG